MKEERKMENRNIQHRGALWRVEGWEIRRKNGFVMRQGKRQISLRRKGALEWLIKGKPAWVKMEEGMLFRMPHAQRLELGCLTVVQRDDRVFELWEGSRLQGSLRGVLGPAPFLEMETDASSDQAALLTALALAMLDCEENFIA